MKLSHQNL